MESVLKEIISRRDLVRELVFKDLKLRYSRPALGVFWMILSPLFTVAVFYLVFALILKVSTPEAPFVLYLMSAVFTWRFFYDSLMCSTTSLFDNRNLVRESGFPHYLLPLSIVLSNAVIFLPSLAILLACAAWLLKGASIWLVLLPLVFALQLLITFGLSLMCSIYYVRFRDIRYILESILLLLFYLTPAFYSLSLVRDMFPPALFNVYMYNPFTILLNFYRLVCLKGFCLSSLDAGYVRISAVALTVFSFLVLSAGFAVYKKFQRNINDYLSH